MPPRTASPKTRALAITENQVCKRHDPTRFEDPQGFSCDGQLRLLASLDFQAGTSFLCDAASMVVTGREFRGPSGVIAIVGTSITSDQEVGRRDGSCRPKSRYFLFGIKPDAVGLFSLSNKASVPKLSPGPVVFVLFRLLSSCSAP
jgi:hypothetical protein